MYFLLMRTVLAEPFLDQEWTVVNDSVMGGLSASEVSLDKESQAVMFQGNVSLKNNGGFASIRLRNTPNLKDLDGIEIKATGEDKTYQLVVWVGMGPRLYYKHDFSPSDDPQRIYFSDFTPVSYGRSVFTASLPNNLSAASSVGILIGDKQKGSFSLKLHTLEGFKDEQANSSMSNDPPKIITEDMYMMLQRAIQRGVPAYNNGSAEVCAAIYQTALEDLILLKKEDLSLSQIQKIEQVLLNSASLNEDQKAWAFRYVIDDLLSNY